MRLIIEVHHTIKLDPALMDLLKAIYPNQAALDALAKDVQDKTSVLSSAVDANTPAT